MPTDVSNKIRVSITIAKDSMSASVLLKKPLPDDPPITEDEIFDALKEKEIVFGIDNDIIEKIIREKEFNTPIKIVLGEKPEKGKNSEFKFHFDTVQDKKPEVDEDGRIDYKNIHFIQNVEKDQLLVTKIPPVPGREGTNIFEKKIKGPDGRDLPFKNGSNTEISEDGSELKSSINGAIVFLHGKVSVNDVMVIKGDVDFNTGNIECLGSVRVSGNVKTGFEIKTEGDLEVNGNIEDCNITAKGNIMVKGGFFGAGSGLMKAEGEIFIKFAEGQRIEAKGNITIGGEVVNCQILCGGNILVKGKKSKIVGGETKAHKEIRAGFLGSSSGTQTYLSVAYDPELMQKYSETVKETNRLTEDSVRIKEVLVGLYRLQMDNKLTNDQQAALEKLEEFQKDLPLNLENLETEKKRIEEELRKLEGAQIIAETAIYSGVRASFGLIYRDVLEESERCMLTLEGNKILFSELKTGD